MMTCESCKFLIGKDESSDCVFGYLPKNLYEDDFGCIKHKTKDSELAKQKELKKLEQTL